MSTKALWGCVGGGAVVVLAVLGAAAALLLSGAWGDGSLDRPVADGHGNLVLSRAARNLKALDLDADQVYFVTDRIERYRTRTRLRAVPKAGGPTRLLAVLDDQARDVAADERVVWVATAQGLFSVDKASGSAERLTRYPESVYSVMVAADEVVWVNARGIFAWPKRGGPPRGIASLDASFMEADLAVDGEWVYLATPRLLGRAPLQGGEIQWLMKAVPELLPGFALAGDLLLARNWRAVLAIPADVTASRQICAGVVANAGGFHLRGESLWLGRQQVRYHGDSPKPRGSAGRSGGVTKGTFGGLYECRWRTGSVSGNLAPGTDSVVAIDSDEGAVYFGDDTTGLIARRDLR